MRILLYIGLMVGFVLFFYILSKIQMRAWINEFNRNLLNNKFKNDEQTEKE